MSKYSQAALLSIPFFLLLVLVLTAKMPFFEQNYETLSHAFLLDILLVLPILYLLITSRTKVPNLTAFPFFVLCLITFTEVIKINDFRATEIIKNSILPLFEVVILLYVIYAIYKKIKESKQKKLADQDFYTTAISVCQGLFPKFAAHLVATEVAVIYYTIFCWGHRETNDNEFTYHKNTGAKSILGAFFLLIILETVGVHFFVLIWSNLAAWIVTSISIYTGIQLLGLMKSLSRRPIRITEKKLQLHYGIFSQCEIELCNILDVRTLSTNQVLDESTIKMSPMGPLEGHNIQITAKQNVILYGLFNSKKTFNKIALHIDDNIRFLSTIQKKMMDNGR